MIPECIRIDRKNLSYDGNEGGYYIKRADHVNFRFQSVSMAINHMMFFHGVREVHVNLTDEYGIGFLDVINDIIISKDDITIPWLKKKVQESIQKQVENLKIKDRKKYMQRVWNKKSYQKRIRKKISREQGRMSQKE